MKIRRVCSGNAMTADNESGLSQRWDSLKKGGNVMAADNESGGA